MFGDYMGNSGYVMWASSTIGMPLAERFANTFVSSLATLEVPDREPLRSVQPLYVARSELTDSMMTGLIYSNGAVFYIDGEDTALLPLLLIFINVATCDENNLASRTVTINPT